MLVSELSKLLHQSFLRKKDYLGSTFTYTQVGTTILVSGGKQLQDSTHFHYFFIRNIDSKNNILIFNILRYCPVSHGISTLDT